jgi:hypothetical protein
MKKAIGFSTLLAVSVSCAPASKDSTLNSAFDRESNPEQSGLESLNYEAMKNAFEKEPARTERLPWTDTYWPSVNQGLSHRWARLAATVTSEIGLVDFLDTHLNEAGKAKPSVYLSPAEKYDMIYRWRHNKALSAETLAGLRTELAAKEAEVMATQDLAQKRTAVGQMYDALNASRAALQSVMPLSRDGWTTWTNRTSSPDYMYLNQDGTGAGWGWEGLCHGWAPAALYSEAPKHGVKVKMDDKEILVTEGDIRGLLTYSWANHSPDEDQYFIGRRCNIDVDNEDSRGPTDESGRNVYGSLQKTATDAKVNFSLVEELTPDWLASSWIYGVFNGNASSRLYTISLHDGEDVNSYLLELNYYDQSRRRWSKMFFHTDTMNQLKKFVSDQTAPQPAALASVDINGCGDVNPAVLHTTMIKALKIDKIGFVIDRTQSGQVWNQPVYAANVDVGPAVQVSTLLATHPDLIKRLAPNAAMIAQVNARLQWTYEPQSASMDYDRAFDERYATGPSSLQYILEFDKNGQLIGGEWGTLENTQPSSQVPDFIFGFKKDSKPTDSLNSGFDYTGIIGQIHACSLKDKADGSEIVRGKAMSYVNCEITKAAP